MSDLRLLPRDPVLFFELESPYDRRDLKRAYGKAIRQYKPESHPAEFQLIRDAFEKLERQLRYGRQQQQYNDVARAWAPPDSPVVEHVVAPPRKPHANSPGGANTAASSKPKPEITLRQLALINPTAALRKLQAKTQRTAPDYYLAAVLMDASGGKPTAKYLGQLIEGLVAHPSDPGLTALATEFLRQEVPDAMAAKIVQHVAENLRSPLFYMLTESLWSRMASTMPFENVSRMLKTCERSIHQTQPAMRNAFYLRLLRTAIWTAPKSWTDKVLAEIESQSAILDVGTQNELEFLSEIRQLQQLRSHRTDPVRSKLFEALQLACQVDEAASVARITDILSNLGRDAAAVQQAFPLPEAVDGATEDDLWVSLVHKIVFQMQSYLIEADEVPSDRIVAQTIHLLEDLQPTAEQVLAGVERARSRFKQMPLLAWLVFGSIFGTLVILTIGLMIFGDFGGAILFWIAALFVGLLVSFNRWVFPKFLKDPMQRWQHRWLVKDYSKYWRSRMFRFVQSNPETIGVHAARIEAVSSKLGREDLSSTVQYFLRQDAGLCLFAAIRTVLR